MPKAIKKGKQKNRYNPNEKGIRQYSGSGGSAVEIETSDSSNVPILLIGKKGAGKDMAATKIFANNESSRKQLDRILPESEQEYEINQTPDEELKRIIDTALDKKPDFDHKELRTQDESIYRFEGFIGGSPAMQTVYRQIRQVAPTNIPVLLLGETGTGKDLAAQAIHRLSPKRTGQYIPVNLGALPSELIASELVGHEKGSFTGAYQQQKGVFETGSDGTVFIDEIESIGNKVQVSLLRLIEEKKITRLGGRRSIYSDARIIAASNEDLEELVSRGKFREDLFFRLDVFRIVLPPLRDRISDISLIAEDLIARFNYELNKNILRIKPECMTALEQYDWPGNVRELKNIIQRAVLLCEDEEIGEEHLPRRLHRKSEDPSRVFIDVGTSLNEVEKRFIQRTLSHTGNNRKKAAELLGITRRALYNKLHKHAIR